MDGDDPGTRRRLLIYTVAAAVIAGVAMAVGGTGGMTVKDLVRMPFVVNTMLRIVPVSDYLNTLALVAPLAWLAPWLAGRAALQAFVRRRAMGPLLLGALVSLPVLWMVPANTTGIGAHRDWDLASLGGLTLTLAAGALLASLPVQRLRGILIAVLPVLALGCGGWLLVNANTRAVLLRAQALAEQPPGLIGPAAGNLHGWMGQRAMDLGEPAFAAPEFERSFDLEGNPRRALLAVEAFAGAGDLANARRMMARAKAAGPFSITVAASMRQLDALLAAMAADSARAARAAASDSAR